MENGELKNGKYFSKGQMRSLARCFNYHINPLFQFWDFILQRIPNDVVVHAKIVMDELVTHSGVAFPVHKRVLDTEFIGKVFDGLANHLEAACKSPDKHFIMDECLEAEVLRLRGEEVYLLCLKNSISERDIAYFFKDMRLQKRAEALQGDDLCLSVEQVFQKIGKADKVLVSLFVWLKLHQHIHIAGIFLFAPHEGAEQADFGNAIPGYFRPMLSQQVEDLFTAGHFYFMAGLYVFCGSSHLIVLCKYSILEFEYKDTGNPPMIFPLAICPTLRSFAPQIFT